MIEMKEYSTEELKSVLKITRGSWERYKDELLDYMKSYFDFEIVKKGRKICYLLKEQYQEWVPFKRKDVEKQKAYYKVKTDEIIAVQSRNTGSNIARIIDKYNMNIYNHKEGTICNYIRPILREDYLAIDRAWCQFDKAELTYTPITEEQLEFLYGHFDSADLRMNTIIDIIGDMESGDIDDITIAKDIINLVKKPFEAVMVGFQNKYGFRPIRVSNWEKVNLEFDAESFVKSMPDRINKMIEEGKIDLSDPKYSWIEE